MTTSNDRLDQIETLIANFLAASVADRQNSNERMTRIEQTIERQQRQIEVLATSAADHEVRTARQDALIERLDAILERMIYREGRGDNDQRSQP